MGRRLIAVFCLFALCAAGLFVRVGGLSLDSGLAATAAAQSRYTLSFGETRGSIYDCRMLPLVDGEARYVAACLPQPGNKNALLNSNYLLGDTAALMRSGRPFLSRCATDTLDIPGVRVFPVAVRTGPSQLARHIVGYQNSDGVGVTGIEKAYDGFLRQNAATSSITYQVDAAGAPLAGNEPQVRLAPEPVEGVVLTIDRRLQEIVERVGEAMLPKGAIVVMEPATGKLRACASFPQYNPNDLSAAMRDEANSPLLNRAFCAYNVGSTFKIVTAAAALTQGISPHAVYECTGSIEVFGAPGTQPQKIHCHRERGHGPLEMRGAMMASCNPYFIEIGLRLDKPGFLNMARDLSFGKATEFADGFSTAAGVVPDFNELRDPAAVANFSFGQGRLTATPIQVAQMVCAVVNGGGTPSASLVEGFTSDGKLVDRRRTPSAPIKAMSARVAETLREFLVASVEEEPNQNAKPRYVDAGGKTGTAQSGQFKAGEDGEPEEILRGWFAGFFPAENPRYVVAIVNEDAASGNQGASPVFRAIADAVYAPIKLAL